MSRRQDAHVPGSVLERLRPVCVFSQSNKAAALIVA